MESRRIQPQKNNNYEYDLPTEDEINRVKRLKNKQLNNKNSIDDEEDFDDIDENITINQPNNYNSPHFNNLHINNPNNINSINIINEERNDNNIRNNINNRNNNNNYRNNSKNNINNNINNRLESFLDQEGNIIYRNQSEDLEVKILDSHRIKVGNDEFEDLTKEAREIQNKEAFEKKILGIVKSNNDREIKVEKKPLLERVGNFIDNHEEAILATIDGIGCILLHGPSIVRTINRIDRWFDNLGNISEQQPSQQNEENNIINNLDLRSKNKDLNTILKFLPVWEVRENKKHENNNNCVICLNDFDIGDIISALPCCHVFHTECIENWMKNELTCPVCKFEITLSSIIGRNNN